MNTNTQATLDQLQQLKLYGMARRYEAIIALHSHEQPSGHLLAAQLAEAEESYRNHRRTELYLRLSKLRYHAVPEQINCSESRGITKEQLASFCDGSFIERAENILITGATGSGKSYLACALGRQACMLGIRTIYFSMNRFIEALSLARLDGSYIKLLNQIAKTPLLILDDFGLQPLTQDLRITLLQILEDRYAKGATILTSQLPSDKWFDYINDPTLADAICDRLTANAHRVNLIGESMRKRKI